MNTVSHIALTLGMFGSEFRNTSHAFGLSCGQMRPTEHNCPQCGLNPSWGQRVQGPVYENGRDRRAPLAWCGCNLPKRRCEKLTHNSSWFNTKGEKLGWGDLCTCDLARLSAECGEAFYVLSESDSYWDLHRQIKDGKMGPDATLDHPGIDYVRAHATWVVKGGQVYGIRHRYDDPGEDKVVTRGSLTFTLINREKLKDL